MEKFVLDTNVFIDAIRSADARRELAAFQRVRAPQIHQHAVVAAEILAGAGDDRTFERWHDRWISPSERVGRVIAPGYGTWLGAARLIMRLFQANHIATRSVPSGFLIDCLIATSAREHGCTVITHNIRNYELIARVLPGLRYARPFP